MNSHSAFGLVFTYFLGVIFMVVAQLLQKIGRGEDIGSPRKSVVRTICWPVLLGYQIWRGIKIVIRNRWPGEVD